MYTCTCTVVVISSVTWWGNPSLMCADIHVLCSEEKNPNMPLWWRAYCSSAHWLHVKMCVTTCMTLSTYSFLLHAWGNYLYGLCANHAPLPLRSTISLRVSCHAKRSLQVGGVIQQCYLNLWQQVQLRLIED